MAQGRRDVCAHALGAAVAGILAVNLGDVLGSCRDVTRVRRESAGPAIAARGVVTLAVNLVSRIAASLRMGWWNDEAAEIVPLQVADLDATVRSFGGCAIYGWEFIDPPEESWRHWRDRLSVDVRPGQDESAPRH